LIEKNVAEIRKNIASAAMKSGRYPEDIKLIGVTKTIEISKINELLVAGVKDIGENRVQEFLPKYEALNAIKPTWHFIGHLQRNKVKYIADKVDLIHSVESLSLAQEIDKCAAKHNRVIDFLVEVNIGMEASKFGVSPDDVLGFVEKLLRFPNIRFAGLMCIAPFVENPEENRLLFGKMRNLRVDITRHLLYDTPPLTLSMGMTGDYVVAIEEGATMIRIGTALFRS